jgi:hypothetical protein
VRAGRAQREAAADAVDDLADDGESESGPGHRAGELGVDLVERLQDAFVFGRRDAGPAILDVDGDAIAGTTAGDGDEPPLPRRELDRVVDQVLQQQPHVRLRQGHKFGVRGEVDLQRRWPWRGGAVGGEFGQQQAQIAAAALVPRTLEQLGELEQPVDQGAEILHALLHLPPQLGLLRGRALVVQVDRARERRQRRAQLVRDQRDEVALEPLLAPGPGQVPQRHQDVVGDAVAGRQLAAERGPAQQLTGRLHTGVRRSPVGRAGARAAEVRS